MDATLKRELERERELGRTKFRKPRCACGEVLKGASAHLLPGQSVCQACKVKT